MQLSLGLNFIVLVLMLSGCATSSRDKIYEKMGIAALVGVAVGQAQPNYKATYSTMYAGVGAATAAALSLYLDDPYKESVRLRDEVKVLTSKFEQFENGKVVKQGPATFGAKVPDKYKGLIQPGEWRIYEIDQWVESDDNRLIHQDKIMELTPPSLVPNSN